MPTKKPAAKKALSSTQRAAMIEQLAADYIDAEMDDGARETLYEYIVKGCKGLNDYNSELRSEYRESYGAKALRSLLSAE